VLGAGFREGRRIVLIYDLDNATTNAHGLYALQVHIRWYRDMRLIDLMAVGGSGGHSLRVHDLRIHRRTP
jgi:hypothetical protein